MTSELTVRHSSASAEPPARMPGLDGIRTVAVTVVLLVHADVMPGGFIGVDLFFVLSGFLITTLMLEEITRQGHLDLVGFWIRRAVRLLPAAIAFLGAGMVAAALTKPESLAQVVRNSVAVVLGVFNYAYAPLGGSTAWDGHLWSLSVEAQFYLFWPLVVILGLRTARRRGLVALGIVTMALIALWRACVGLGFVPGHTDWYHSTDTRIDAFIAGATLALALSIGLISAHTASTRRFWGAAAPIGWGIITLACLLSPRLQEDPRWAYLGGLSLVAGACTLVVGSTLLRPETPFSRLLVTTPMAYIGRISYAFYLWHFPVIFGLEPVLDHRITRYGTVVVAFVVSLILADLSMRLVERPASRLRPRIEALRPLADLRRVPALNPVSPPVTALPAPRTLST